MKKFIYCLMAAAMVASCNDSNLIEDIAGGKEVTLQASIESNASRASIENGKILWSEGDKIAVLIDNGKYGELILAEGAGQGTGVFKGNIVGGNLAEEGFHAYYPSTIAASATTVTLPASYEVGADLANSNALMKATGTGSLTFKHLGGVIKFTLKNVPAGSSKVRFTTLDNKDITGTFTITDDGENESIAAAEGTGSNSTIEICFDALAAVGNIEVTVPLPTGTYTGIKLEVLDATDNYTVVPVNAPAATNTVARACRVTMPPVTFVAIEAGAEGMKVADGVYETGENEYSITNKKGMFWVANQVNKLIDNFGGKVIKLANNIDMENDPWTPIGLNTGYQPEFAGSFDGNNKTISNLNVTDTRENIAAAGLFGYVTTEHVSTKGYICDLTIDHATVVSTHLAGAVAAWAQGAYTIRNCRVTNSTITSQVELIGSEYDNGDKVGGVVGYIAQKGTTIDGCSVENVTVTGYRDIGGVCGYVNGAADAPTTFTNNTVGAGVKIVQDLRNSYKSEPGKLNVGAVCGFLGATTASGNTGTAEIVVKAYDTATAQLALDAATSGRTIELAAGTYGELILRHTKSTTVIKDESGNDNASGKYYHRTLQDFTIKAAEGETVTVDGITINSGHVYTADASKPAYNYVVDEKGVAIQSTNVYNYYGSFHLKNFVIDGFTLTKNVYIGADSSTETNQFMDIDGFTLQNCQIIGTDETKKTDNGNKLIRIGGPSGSSITNPLRIRNVTVRYCLAKDVFQGVYAYGPVDYTVENCEFDNLGHNVFSVGAGKNTFKNNVIKNCSTDRLFRVTSSNFPEEDWIKILDNTITNSNGRASDTTYPYYKSETATVNITFSGNTMDGTPWSPLSE